MRVIKVSEISQMSDKETVPSVRVTIVSLDRYLTGTNDSGSWSIQNGVIRDSSGSVRVMFNGRDQLPSTIVGKTVLIESKQGDKGLSGLYARSDDKTKAMYLRVTATAEISAGDCVDNADQEESPPQPAQRSAPGRPSAPAAPPPRRPDPEPEHVQNDPEEIVVPPGLSQLLTKRANLYLLCLKATDYVAAQRGDMSEGQKQACCSSLYIDMVRAAVSMEMPSCSFDRLKPKK